MSTVLIIEDNEKNRRLARDVLEFGGFSTMEASSAEEGVVLACDNRPDVILMDIQLPGMDGVEALASLRARPDTRAIPVAAMTAFAMSEDRERLLAVGFDAYIAKPIDIDDLTSTVRHLCGSPEGQPS